MITTTTTANHHDRDDELEKVKTDDSKPSRKQAQSGSPQSEKVKTSGSDHSRKQAKSVDRELIVTSREMDFLSEKELVNQTGHAQHEWHLVFLKELLDNALDACDDEEIPPDITVVTRGASISVSDNGPGIPQETIDKALDFRVRAPSREAYVAPDRGAQGNAMMTLLTMPYVVDPENGRLEINSNNLKRTIRVSDDPITQRPKVSQNRSEVAGPRGTTVSIHWKPVDDRDVALGWPIFDEYAFHPEQIRAQVANLIAGFRLFNPHAKITLDWFGEVDSSETTDTDWKKWKPSKPSSSHWYDLKHFKRLIAALITTDRDRGDDRTVHELLSIFDGFSGSKKRSQVLDSCDMQRVKLSGLIDDDGALNESELKSLLSAMKAATKAVTPKRLGLIGEDHFRECFLQLGAVEESIRYAKKLGVEEATGLPYVVEMCFANQKDTDATRIILPGVNWSGAIKNPFRSLGKTGQSLDSILSDQYASSNKPVIFGAHLAHPRVQYTDRGKSAIALASGRGGQQ